MAMTHESSGEPMSLAPLGQALPAMRTAALLKAEQLELIRIVLRAGEHLPEHRVDGEITFLCIEGRFDFMSSNASHRIGPGELVHLARNEAHGVRAVEDASALLTICLPRDGRHRHETRGAADD